MFAVDSRWIYMDVSLAFLAIWIILWILFRETRQYQWRVSIRAAPGGPVAELFYFQDYWHPGSIFPYKLGVVTILPEDFIFAFAFTGIVSILYPIVFAAKMRPAELSKRKPVHLVLLAGIVALCLFLLGINSIYATAVGFVVAAIVMVTERPDLLVPSLWSGALIVALYFIFLFSMFSLVQNVEELTQTFWLLHGTNLGTRVWGGVPMTELVWSFCFGLLFGTRRMYMCQLKFS